MLGIVLPLLDVDVVAIDRVPTDVAVNVHIDVVAAPIDVVAPNRIADGEAGTPYKPGRQRATKAIARRWRVVVGLIAGIGPGAIDDIRIVVRHIDLLGIGGLNRDHFLGLAALRRCLSAGRGGIGVLHHRLRDRHGLLWVRLKCTGFFGASAQGLHRVHHIGLLRKHCIAEFLCPVQILVHHLKDIRHSDEILEAIVPILSRQRRLQGIPLEVLVVLVPAFRLHDFQRIG